MDLTTTDPGSLQIQIANSFEEAKSARDHLLWQQLSQISVEEAVNLWLSTFGSRTKINYTSGIKMIVAQGLLSPLISLQAFSLLNHEAIIDRIKLVPDWSECTRQARAACYISFTRFLSRRSQGMIQRAIPSREGASKTFFRVYEKVKSKAMTQSQWIQFFEALQQNSPRECLVAKLILQGGKRVSEVLSLQSHQIDWERRKITFEQSKTRGLRKSTVISYPQSIMEALRAYIGDRTGHVFITRNGKEVMLNQVAWAFAKAGKIANLPFKITPHVLRATTVTYLKQQGFQDSDIMKVTGHASSAMVCAYDKTEPESNATEKINLIA